MVPQSIDVQDGKSSTRTDTKYLFYKVSLKFCFGEVSVSEKSGVGLTSETVASASSTFKPLDTLNFVIRRAEIARVERISNIHEITLVIWPCLAEGMILSWEGERERERDRESYIVEKISPQSRVECDVLTQSECSRHRRILRDADSEGA